MIVYDINSESVCLKILLLNRDEKKEKPFYLTFYIRIYIGQ